MLPSAAPPAAKVINPGLKDLVRDNSPSRASSAVPPAERGTKALSTVEFPPTDRARTTAQQVARQRRRTRRSAPLFLEGVGVALTGATLKRVALAKLPDITLVSAGFGGERIVFSPWLTVVIDHGAGA